jgi:L-arabinose isomerase
VLSSAASPELLRLFAAMCDIEFLQIDHETRIEQFADKIRWNAAYYYLSRKI